LLSRKDKPIFALGRDLTFKPSPVVAERLRALGRTEDVMFSPDQTRLAIAGFNENKVLVLGIEVVTEDGVLSIRSDACVELHGPDFNCPHGVFWLDDSTLAVANRAQDAVIVAVPAVSDAGEAIEVEPLLRLSEGDDSIVKSPGSVAVTRLNDEYFDLLVCNNYLHYISRHIIQRKNGFEVVSSLRLFESGLKVPDGLAVSSDGHLVAVSNHYGNRIDVFRNDRSSSTHSEPAFSLGIPNYPHGVRFGMDDRLVLVADAGAPLVHVFARKGEEWRSAKGPSMSIKVIDDDAFQRGRTNPEEGGPKGLDIRADGSFFVVSCEEEPIAFVDFRALRDQLVGEDSTNHRQSRSGDARLLETALAVMKGQHDQYKMPRVEIIQLQAPVDQSLDRRILPFFKRVALKAIASGRRGGH
jgi:hypothetical protein